MNNADEAIQTIKDALDRQDPQLLLQLSEHFSTWEMMLNLRKWLNMLIIHPLHYELIFQWIQHQDPIIARVAAAIVLFVHDIDLQVHIFERLLEIDIAEFPYQLAYNSGEKEFRIDLPGAPGIGVSHYGRDDVGVDQFLLVLEKIYAKIYPDRIPPFFRV